LPVRAAGYPWWGSQTQLVVRIDNDLAKSNDHLIAEGVVESRSDVVRKGRRALIERTRRRRTAGAIIAGYTHHPQTEDEVAWAVRSILRQPPADPQDLPDLTDRSAGGAVGQ
jgi:Arc/MetJ-type ribon-helix-helix transcriptional regulator